MAYASLAVLLLVSVGLLVHSAKSYSTPPQNQSCDSVDEGFQCDPSISRFWGPNSPYFRLHSDIPDQLPQACSITFAQILSRHGARDPSDRKTAQYNATIQKIHRAVKTYKDDFAFIKEFEYTLGANTLSVFGQQQLVNSGIKFFDRYKDLALQYEPFVRSTDSERVVESAVNWTQGFYKAKLVKNPNLAPTVIFSEDDGYNNTLSHSLCTPFEDGPYTDIGDDAKEVWANVFVPPIQARLNDALPGANLSVSETIDVMELCPFETVATPQGTLSQFCSLFTTDEWQQYDYHQTLYKYYGIGPGNPLGPTQGVGWINELIARLTSSPVQDHTSTNSTIDSNPATFPVDKAHRLFADFSHDSDLTGIMSGLGLYNATKPPSNTTMESVGQTKGFAASWIVPFASRMYVEKMQCSGQSEELVRLILNDRVMPLDQCGGDELGRCTVSKFVESLSFAREGGHWDECFP